MTESQTQDSTVARLVPSHYRPNGTPEGAATCSEPPIRIRVLGEFRITIDSVEVPARRNMPRVPWELLQCCVAHGDRPMPQEHLEELLWPDSDGDAAYRALITTVYRLRKLLGDKEALLFRNRTLALNPALCWVDAWEFERSVSNLRNLTQLERSLELYGGPFLSGVCENPMALAACERLRRKYLRAVLCVGADLERQRRPDLAVALYERALDIEPQALALLARMQSLTPDSHGSPRRASHLQ